MGNDVSFIYTNYKGETSFRRVLPISIRFGTSEWHPKPQWIMKSLDLVKKADREFAMNGISEWFEDEEEK